MRIASAADHKKAIEVLEACADGECSLIFEDRLRLALEAVKYEQIAVVPDSNISMDAQAMCC